MTEDKLRPLIAFLADRFGDVHARFAQVGA